MWYIAPFRTISLFLLSLLAMSGLTRADIVLNFNDVPAGTVTVSSYQSQGFTLTSNNSSGFVFNSPDTGNGSMQTLGSNPYYAGANGLAAVSPATINLTQTDGNPFSLLSIDLARNDEYDKPPVVTFTGSLVGGGTVQTTFTVTTSPPPSTPAFQPFSFAGLGFTDLTSVSWDQPYYTTGLSNQFTNITLSTVPEPSTVFLMAIGTAMILGLHFRARRRGDGHERDRSSH